MVRGLMGLAVGIAWMGAIPASLAQVDDEREIEQREARRGEVLLFGLRQSVVEGWVNRMVDDSVERYGFDAEQNERTREIFRESIPGFLREHRRELQDLMNDFLDARFADEAPTAEFVQKWAQRALPLMDKFKDVITDSTDRMREFMTGEQQIQLDAEYAAFDAVFNIGRNKVGAWSEGGFEPGDWPSNEREQRRIDVEQRKLAEAAAAEARAKARAEAGAAPDGAIATDVGAATPAGARNPKTPAKVATAQPLDEFTRYVEDFIKEYKLKPDQQNKARDHLRHYKGQRDNYLRLADTLTSMERLDTERKAAKTDDERREVDQKIAKLTEPVDRYFRQLKEKLDTIPTRIQRQERLGIETSAKPQPG